MPWSSKWGSLKWGQGRWGYPGKSNNNAWTASFQADGKATFNIGTTRQGFAAHFTSAGASSGDSFAAHLKMRGQIVAQGVTTIVWTSHQKFVGAFQVDRRDYLWKHYLNGLQVDRFPKDWDGGQKFWKDGLANDLLESIPEVVFFSGFKGKEFKYYLNGLQTDGLTQDGSQSFWHNGLAYDFIDTPLTNEATFVINGKAAMTAATRQAFVARFNIGGAASVQFGTKQTHAGRFTAAGKASMSITKHNSAMFAQVICNGLATVTFMSGIGSVKITCVDTGFNGFSGPAPPAISFLYDAPYSY